MITEINDSLKNALKSLENRSFTKFICGAANTNTLQVERLATVCALSGFDLIDISPNIEVYNSAKTGLAKAREIYEKYPKRFPAFTEPLIMVSINVNDDPHFNKVRIDSKKCKNCLICTDKCPSDALKNEKDKLKFNPDSCYGCGRCLGICNAITMIKNKNQSALKKLNFEAIEIHTGNSPISEVAQFLTDNSKIIDKTGLISFSIESGLFSQPDLLNYATSLIKLINKKVIIQVDGRPMGATNQTSSSLQPIAAADFLINSNINAYIQVAGGVNHMTKRLLSELHIDISGVGYGTFIRKIVLPYIEGINDKTYINNLYKCVNITTNLVKNMANP